MVFQKNNTVEDGRVRAHETAEAASGKVHEIIDKVAEHTEQGSELAKELRATASEQAASARESAESRAADLLEQAEDAKKQAGKDAKRRKKATAKKLKNSKKKADKQLRKSQKKASKQVDKSKKQASKDIQDMRGTLVDEVLPKVTESASGLAAAGAVAGRKAADEASARAPEVIAALRDQRDPQAALAAAKGQKVKKKGRKRRLLFIAVVVGGVAAVIAKQMQGQKKDPWAVPAGDPYKAPTTGRQTSVPVPAPAVEKTDSAAPAVSDPLAVPAAIGEDPLADPTAAVTDTPEAREQDENVEGSDAWSSARDWADDSAVPSTSDTSEGSDLHTDHLGGDLPVEGDDKA